MPSPIPGMDPFLEQAGLCRDFRVRFLSAVAAWLSPQVLPECSVRFEKRGDEAEDVERDAFLKVIDNRSREVVTVIELLSPTNKRPGANRERYLARRAEVLNSPAHLVEIDLLRAPQPMPAAGRPVCDYSILVSRASRRPGADFWPVGLREPLPVVPVPLREGEPDARLDLRSVLDRVYDEAGYRYFAYSSRIEPPLTPDEAAWANALHQAAETPGP